MDAAERALLEQAVGSALSGGDTIEASDGALAELGWLENARGRATRHDRGGVRRARNLEPRHDGAR